MQGLRVPSVVRELKSHMPCDQNTKTFKKSIKHIYAMFCSIFQGKVPVSPPTDIHTLCEILAPIFRRFTLRDSLSCVIYPIPFCLRQYEEWPNLARQMELWESVSRAHASGREGFSLAGSLRRRPRTQLCLPVSWRWSLHAPRCEWHAALTVELNGCLKVFNRDFPGVQWLRLHALCAKGPGSLTPWSVTEILQNHMVCSDMGSPGES